MIQVFIPSYRCIEYSGSHSKPYNVYTIQINYGNRTYSIERRYSDFLQLHKDLRRQYETPEFPPKRVRNNRSIVLESRRLVLQAYLQTMVKLNPIPKEIINFLNIHHQRQATSSSSASGGIGQSNTMYDDHANHSFFIVGNNGFDENMQEDKSWTMNSFMNPAAAFAEDPFLVESDSSSSNLSDCVTRGVLDALYQTDI